MPLAVVASSEELVAARPVTKRAAGIPVAGHVTVEAGDRLFAILPGQPLLLGIVGDDDRNYA